MPRRFVNELSDNEKVDQVFLAADKQVRANRQGNHYLQVELSDKTGTLSARLWNVNDEITARFENGDYVRVTGTTQIFQGALQLIAKEIEKIDAKQVDTSHFVRLTAPDIQRLAGLVVELLRSITQPQLAALAESFINDEPFTQKFIAAPAAVKNHHAYRGGLLEHVANLMDLAQQVSQCYPSLDRDQLLMGVFLHDVGKIDELSYDRDLAYTEQGQLLGHIVLAVELLDAKAAETEARTGEQLDPELLLRLKHMIVSHHGSLEFGSPTVPMTLEALALHHLDNLDAKLHHFEQLLREDPNHDSPWTQYQHNIGRKLFKGRT